MLLLPECTILIKDMRYLSKSTFSQNDNYAIVDPKTDYGIALYDHIALDGSKVKENQLVIQ